MISIKVFGSGSSGNGYLLDNGGSQLMLEAGLPYKKVAPQMFFDFSKVQGILITHEHGDHAKYLKQYLDHTTAPVCMTAGTAKALSVSDLDESWRISIVKPLRQFRVGGWLITPFSVEHDAAEPVGYLIDTEVGDRLIYITDTYYVKYTFPHVTQMMVEMNYSDEIANDNVSAGLLDLGLKKRIMKSHFEMENSLAFIKANRSKKLERIVLIHISGNNGNPQLFLKKTEELTGVPVYTANSLRR